MFPNFECPVMFPNFGVPSLDALLGHGPANEDGAPNLCIIGPDGAGKSVLALHLASRYMGLAIRRQMESTGSPHCTPDAPCVIYVSTDLSKTKADQVWNSFWLDRPFRRDPPFRNVLGKSENKTYSPAEESDVAWKLSVSLDELSPSSPTVAKNGPDLAEYLVNPEARYHKEADFVAHVAFLNLAADSAGDDWGFLNRTLTLLPKVTGFPHVMIVDAIEGLETLVGDRDSYGELRSRRSRVAQLVRNAGKECQLVFVVEEPQEGERLPEEFVADYVVRLRTATQRDYARRTVEIAKARGRAHTRGQHAIVFRGSDGSTTGQFPNWDDPLTLHSYVHVFHSLDALYRQLMRHKTPGQLDRAKSDRTESLPFGIEHLDSMLRPGARSGLPAGRVTALIGDDGTHKSRLTRAFLSGALSDNTETSGVAVLITTQLLNAASLLSHFRDHWKATGSTTELDISEHEVAERLYSPDQEVEPAKPAEEETESERAARIRRENWAMCRGLRIVCRRLEIHHTASAVLFHVIEQALLQAREVLLGGKSTGPLERWQSGETAWRIRLVIDDWSTIKATYPEVAGDPRFLPFLIHYLERHQISTIIVDSQPGGPEQIIGQNADRDLRALTRHALYTWNVRFFGEYRVAISAIPPVSDLTPAVIRELRPIGVGPLASDALEVDPHFELYRGLTSGEPQPIPLRLRLYAETEAFNNYVTDMLELLRQMFQLQESADTVQEDEGRYGRLRAVCSLQVSRRLDHTLVYQLDEFWQQDPAQELLHWRYLTETVRGEDGQGVRFNDPFNLFQPIKSLPTNLTALPDPTSETKNAMAGSPSEEAQEIAAAGSRTGPAAEEKTRRRYRYEGFPACSYYGKLEERKPADLRDSKCDRVPFMWDFGFILCRGADWKAVIDQLSDSSPRGKIVRRVWGSLKKVSPYYNYAGAAGGVPLPPAPGCSWRDFLEACQIVAENSISRGRIGPVYPFDVDMHSTETFSCLVLEIWASELVAAMVPNHPPPRFGPGSPEDDLISRLRGEATVQALYRTFLLLGEVLVPDQFPADEFEFKPRRVQPCSVATRQWYSTALETTGEWNPDDPWIPVRLPGHYSTRGDWFLAVAAGSRSTRLGFQAIDLLNSRRGNLLRLQAGLGLPVRDILAEPEEMEQLRTALRVMNNDGEADHLRYGELVKIGASPESASTFGWLWRSSLQNYHHHARIWGRWLCRIINQWPEWKRTEARLMSSQPSSGFRLYDNRGYQKLTSFKEFEKERESLIALLNAASRSDEDSRLGSGSLE